MAPGFPPPSAAVDCSTGSASALPPTTPFTTLAIAEATCEGTAGAMVLDSSDATRFQLSPIAMAGRWSFGSDQPGKPPGWIGVHSADGSPTWISFPVRVPHGRSGAVPQARVEVTYLRSYEGFVDANVTVNTTSKTCNGRVGRLAGSWKRHQSTPFTLSFGVRDEIGEGEDGYEMLKSPCIFGGIFAGHDYALTISLVANQAAAAGGKFKLLGISACNMASLAESAA